MIPREQQSVKLALWKLSAPTQNYLPLPFLPACRPKACWLCKARAWQRSNPWHFLVSWKDHLAITCLHLILQVDTGLVFYIRSLGKCLFSIKASAISSAPGTPQDCSQVGRAMFPLFPKLAWMRKKETGYLTSLISEQSKSKRRQHGKRTHRRLKSLPLHEPLWISMGF